MEALAEEEWPRGLGAKTPSVWRLALPLWQRHR